MWLLILLFTLLLFLFIAFGLVSYARWNFGSLEKLGIPVVQRDHFLLGSALLTYQKPGGLADLDHMKKFKASAFGIYHGREPQVVVCDAELIRAITAKDAEHFDAKRKLDFGEPLFNEMIEFQPLEKWKVMRGMLTPVLTSSMRIKGANPAMREAIGDFISGIKEKIKDSSNSDGRVDKFCLNEAIYAMLTDLLARSQYSINIGKSDINNRFVQIIRTIMSPPASEEPWLASYVFAFPFLQKMLPNTMINPEPMREFCAILKQLVEMRRKENQEKGKEDRAKDYLDSVVEWFDNLDSDEYKKNNITDVTISSLGLTMFLGGQDQISLILGALFCCISQNPEVEKKLHEEVDLVFSQSKGILDHEALSNLTYLTACITEAARLYPFFFRTERVCTKDWKDTESGLEIKKDTTVIIAMFAANRNPKYFEDPDTFNPDRFMPGKKEKLHGYAFTSFGFGPRACTGKRLAMEVMTLLSAYLLREFRFLKRSDTGVNFVPGGPFFGAHEPIYFDLEKRNISNEE